jgi:hypothetical protein
MTHDEFRALILERLEELDWWRDHPDPDPQLMGERSAEIVREVGEAAAAMGFSGATQASRVLSHDTGPEIAKGFLLCCLMVISRADRTRDRIPVPRERSSLLV